MLAALKGPQKIMQCIPFSVACHGRFVAVSVAPNLTNSSPPPSSSCAAHLVCESFHCLCVERFAFSASRVSACTTLRCVGVALHCVNCIS